MFEVFCSSITSSVESKVCLGHNAVIDCSLACRLIKYGYMLGNVFIDSRHRCNSCPFFPFDLMIAGAGAGMCGSFPRELVLQRILRGRLKNECLLRDNDALYDFYSKYKSEYDGCVGEYNKLAILRYRVESDLYEESMRVIRITST